MPRRRGPRLLPPVVAAGLVPVAALTASVSSADEHPRLIDLDWSAPADCPARDDVVTRVEERIGKPSSPARRSVSARGRITKAPTSPRFRLELSVAGNEANTRTLSGDDCAHLVDAAALILALDIDTLARSEQVSSASAPDVRGEVASPAAVRGFDETRQPPSTPRQHGRSPDRRPTELTLQGGARLTVDEGSLPRTALGVGPVLAIGRGPLMLELQGIVFHDRFTVDGPRRGRGGAWVDLSVIAAHGCWRGAALEVDWRGCVGGEVGLESTIGVSVARPETATGFRSAASAMLNARLLPRSFISPTVGFSVAFPIAAPRVYIEGFGNLFEPPSVVLRGFFGLDVKFL